MDIRDINRIVSELILINELIKLDAMPSITRINNLMYEGFGPWEAYQICCREYADKLKQLENE